MVEERNTHTHAENKRKEKQNSKNKWTTQHVAAVEPIALPGGQAKF